MDNLIAKAKAAALFAWDFMIPRFITEEVAMRYVGGPVTSVWSEWSDYEIACSIDDVQPGERFDGIATVDAFQFLGYAITYRIGNMRPFVNPHGGRNG